MLRYARCSPRKARRVADLIRGKKAGEAMVSMQFMPYGAARIIEKLLRSAMANAEQKKTVDAEQLKVSRVVVDQGPTAKRMMARAMGRGNTIRKKSSHITIQLAEADQGK
jgi:large subunit ribosomal protein L22